MLIPNNNQCREILRRMREPPFCDELSDFEKRFCASNEDRHHFTDRQKEVIAGFVDKYQLSTDFR